MDLFNPLQVGIGLSQKYFPCAHAAATIVTIKAGCQAWGESNPHNCTLAEYRSNLQAVICNLSRDGKCVWTRVTQWVIGNT